MSCESTLLSRSDQSQSCCPEINKIYSCSKFSGHLIGIAPVYVLRQLVLAKFADSAERDSINSCHRCCKFGSKQRCVLVSPAGGLQVLCKSHEDSGRKTKKCRCNSSALKARLQTGQKKQSHVSRNDGLWSLL